MEEQQTAAPAPSPIYQQSQEKNAKWLWLLIAVIILGAIGFAYWRGIGPFDQFRIGKSEVIETPTPQSSAAQDLPSPSPSEAKELDREAPKIRVLNGSGKSGAASSFKDFIEGKGYAVDSVGNAKAYDFEQTIVRFKEQFKKYKDMMFEDLSSDYSVDEGEDLEATDSADIEIIVGSK